MLKVLDYYDTNIVHMTNTCYNTAQLKDCKNLVLLSGGLDSQAVCYYLKQQDISFETIHAEYVKPNSKDVFNWEDRILAETVGIDHLFTVDLDNLYFKENIVEKYSKLYNCTSPQFAVHLHLLDYIFDEFKNYNVIVSSTPMLYHKIHAKISGYEIQYNYPPTYDELVLYRYKKDKNLKNFFPFFWLEFDIAKNLAKSEINHLDGASIYTKKFLLYKQLNLPIWQQMEGYTGFENYKIYLKETMNIKFDSKLRQPYAQNKKQIIGTHSFYNQ